MLESWALGPEKEFVSVKELDFSIAALRVSLERQEPRKVFPPLPEAAG